MIKWKFKNKNGVFDEINEIKWKMLHYAVENECAKDLTIKMFI